MTDTLTDALDWFSGSSETFDLTRAERIEYLASGAPAPIRAAASLLLAIEAWTAPWRLRLQRSAGRVGTGTTELSGRAAHGARRAGRTTARAAGRTATLALAVASGAATAAERLGWLADRLGQAASRRLDRLADADGRVAARIERRLAFLHPANLVRSVQTALMVVGGLAVMAAMALTPSGRGGSTRVAIRPATVSAAPPPGEALVPSDRTPVPVATPQIAPSPARRAPAAVAAPAPKPVPTPAAAARRGALPVGKGMWLYEPQATEGGNVNQIVARAKAVGLTHLYVRTGSSVDGFNAAPFLSQLLPVAHANGIRIIGWDYPYLRNVDQDIARAATAIAFTTPDGQRIDGFAADIEPWNGTVLTPATAAAYSTLLRQTVGNAYPLIACVPRPNPALTNFPFAQLLPSFDAVAPMVYWMTTDPAVATAVAFNDLAPYGKPIIPVGQAYDGGAGAGTGMPSPAQIQEFMTTADQLGAIGASFWSWQAANQPAWDAIKAAPQFVLGLLNPAAMTPGQIRAYQVSLASLGYPVVITGVLDQGTLTALAAYQEAAHIDPTGTLDTLTQSLLLTPVAAPLLGHG